jgi:hypothetical protein
MAMDVEKAEAGGALAELRALMALDVGITWVCWACRVQGHVVHPGVDAARHDAAGHALSVHRDRLALAEIALKLVSEEEKRARLDSMLDGPPIIPPLEDPWDGPRMPLSPLQEELVCDALGCDPDSRHRRQRRRAAESA